MVDFRLFDMGELAEDEDAYDEGDRDDGDDTLVNPTLPSQAKSSDTEDTTTVQDAQPVSSAPQSPTHEGDSLVNPTIPSRKTALIRKKRPQHRTQPQIPYSTTRPHPLPISEKASLYHFLLPSPQSNLHKLPPHRSMTNPPSTSSTLPTTYGPTPHQTHPHGIHPPPASWSSLDRRRYLLPIRRGWWRGV